MINNFTSIADLGVLTPNPTSNVAGSDESTVKENGDSFFGTREDWSRRKHLILSYYLTPAAAKFGKASPDGRVVLLDGFAGRGKYDNNEPGSPIHLGQLASKCRAWRSPVNLQIYNIEQNDVNFASLSSCTKGWVDTKVITNLHGSFRTHLPTVLKESASSLLFAFLDPFKPKHLPFSDVHPLLLRKAKTELLIVFHSLAVFRLVSQVMPHARTDDDTRASSIRTLDAIFGNADWRSFLSGERLLTIDAVADCYAKSLLHACSEAGDTRTAYVCSHAIHARHEVGLKYHVILFTRHPDGCRLINDAFVKERQDVYTKSVRSNQLGLEFEEYADPITDSGHRQRCIMQTLEEFGRSSAPGKIWTVAELTFSTIQRLFGEYNQTEHRNAVKAILSRSNAPRFAVHEENIVLGRGGKLKIEDTTELRFES